MISTKTTISTKETKVKSLVRKLDAKYKKSNPVKNNPRYNSKYKIDKNDWTIILSYDDRTNTISYQPMCGDPEEGFETINDAIDHFIDTNINEYCDYYNYLIIGWQSFKRTEERWDRSVFGRIKFVVAGH